MANFLLSVGGREWASDSSGKNKTPIICTKPALIVIVIVFVLSLYTFCVLLVFRFFKFTIYMRATGFFSFTTVKCFTLKKIKLIINLFDFFFRYGPRRTIFQQPRPCCSPGSKWCCLCWHHSHRHEIDGYCQKTWPRRLFPKWWFEAAWLWRLVFKR